MIAIPVKTNKENTAVSTLFGKAKYFAFIENNKIEILKNEQTGGQGVVNWLKSKNVDTLITSHMGERPFSALLNNSIKVYFAGDERIEVTDVMIKYADGELPLLTSENFHILIKEEGDEHHSNSCCSKGSGKMHNHNYNHNHNMENKLQKAPYKSFTRNLQF
jgi:predicted Fe-Mo cluster-binding NifX family protein